MMYLSAVGPVGDRPAGGRAACAFDVRPASKCRRLPWLCFSLPVAVTLNRFFTLRFVLFLVAMCRSSCWRPGPPDEAQRPAGRIGAKKSGTLDAEGSESARRWTGNSKTVSGPRGPASPSAESKSSPLSDSALRQLYFAAFGASRAVIRLPSIDGAFSTLADVGQLLEDAAG